MTGKRAVLADGFLARSGWATAIREPLAADASKRSYHRLHDSGAGRSAILMDAPPEDGEDVRPFVRIASELRLRGLSAPEIISADPEHGFLLLEDLGDAVFANVCSGRPEIESDLYGTAVGVLVHLHGFPAPPDVRPYDAATFREEAALFTEWYLPAATGQPTPPEVERAFLSLVVDAFRCACEGQAPVLVLRDYHAENIMWLPDRKGIARAGILDFQDAVAGHPAYDLVSLLEDARRDTDEALQREMVSCYLESASRRAARSDAPRLDAEQFEAAYSVLGAQRNLRIVGVFSRLCIRDGKFAYVDLIPRVWSHIRRDLCHAALSGLRDWIAAHAPEPDPGILDAVRNRKNDA